MDKRTTVVNYMIEMATILWTPSSSFEHWSGGRFWRRGILYKGIPYSQSCRSTTLEAFQASLVGNQYCGACAKDTYTGNDCSSSVAMAWRRVNPQFKATSPTHGITRTKYMLPNHADMKAVGQYVYKGQSNTQEICLLNGANTLKEAYQRLQAGDIVLKRLETKGHAMMVMSVARDSITVVHQTRYSSALHSTWRVGERWTFDQLYSEHYIPVTMATW